MNRKYNNAGLVSRGTKPSLMLVAGLVTGLCLVLSPPAQATVTCSDGPVDVTQTLTLTLPPTVIIPETYTLGEELAQSNEVSSTLGSCVDNGEQGTVDLNLTNWTSPNGAADGTTFKTTVPGIGVRLQYTSGGSGNWQDLSTLSPGVDTKGLAGIRIRARLTRLSNVLLNGDKLTPGLVAVGTLVNTNRQINLVLGGQTVISSSCRFDNPTTSVALGDITTTVLNTNTGSDDKTLSFPIRCPGGTHSPGYTLTLLGGSLDSTDNSLIANTGTATGVAIEVRDENNTRVSANHGTVTGGAFNETSVKTLKARMIKSGNGSSEAGTVKATATLTLTIN